MYEFPYGGEQQINLNWIINEIITLHKRLDPDYELPNFDNAFPFMNLNQLNLDWILRELKAIKDLAPTEDAQLLKMVANALIANTYDAETQYNVDDIVYRDSDNRLYKCITATPAGGEPFDSNKWVEVDVGGVLTDLLVNGSATVQPYDSNPAMDGTASAGTSTQYARGDHVHPKDTARVPTSRTVNGKALSSNITLNASDIPNDSNVTGDNTDDALNNLNDAITLLNGAFKTVTLVTAATDFGTTSCFFSANANITLTPSQIVIPIYSKGLFITTGNDGVLYAITSGGELITAYRNGANWTNIHNITDTDNKIESAIAIIADGNTHATITAGQYVYIKNHTALTEGLYKALASTPANDPIAASSVVAVPNGLANAALEESSTEVVLSNKNVNAQITKIGRFCFLESNQDFSSLANGLQIIGTIPAGFRPARYTRFTILNKTSSQEADGYYGTIYSAGQIEIYWGGSAISTATNGAFNVFYLCEV